MTAWAHAKPPPENGKVFEARSDGSPSPSRDTPRLDTGSASASQWSLAQSTSDWGRNSFKSTFGLEGFDQIGAGLSAQSQGFIQWLVQHRVGNVTGAKLGKLFQFGPFRHTILSIGLTSYENEIYPRSAFVVCQLTAKY